MGIITSCKICRYIEHQLYSEVKFVQSCPTLCNPMAYTVHRFLQARILESVAFPFSRASSESRDQTQVSRIAGRFFTSWVTRESQEYWSVAYPFSSRSSQPRNWTGVSCTAGRFFTSGATREAPVSSTVCSMGISNARLLGHSVFNKKVLGRLLAHTRCLINIC